MGQEANAKCKECGIYYTIEPKRGVGKALGMNKSNVMIWSCEV